jgi:hypothetical protein
VTRSSALARCTDVFAGEFSDSPASWYPDFTPWENNRKNGQLSCFDKEPIDPRFEGVKSFAQAPVLLQIRKWCHGEYRLSLSPRYLDHQQVSDKQYANRSPTAIQQKTGVEATTSGSKARRINTLVRRREVGDDTQVISGFGCLPRKTILTRYAARKIFECGQISERKFGLSGVFLTFTLPGSTAASFRALAEYSSYLLVLLKHWIKSHICGQFSLFGSWEPQKRGALHLHLVVSSLDECGLEYLIHMHQPYWRKLLLDLSAATSVDLFRKNEEKTWINDASKPRCDADWLRKNPAHYLAKYVGKEAGESTKYCPFYPTRWTTVDKKTLALAVAERVRVILSGWDVSLARRLFEDLHELATPLADNTWKYRNKMFFEDLTWIFEFSQEAAADFWWLVKAALQGHCGETVEG